MKIFKKPELIIIDLTDENVISTSMEKVDVDDILGMDADEWYTD